MPALNLGRVNSIRLTRYPVPNAPYNKEMLWGYYKNPTRKAELQNNSKGHLLFLLSKLGVVR